MVSGNPSDELIVIDDDDTDGSTWWIVGVCCFAVCLLMISLFVFGENQYDLDAL